MQPSTVQSFVRFPLTHLLASGGHVRVLRALLSHGGAQSAAQLASDCAMTARGVRNTLDALVAQGAVKVMGLIDDLEDLDDTQMVFSNLDVTDELVATFDAAS